jgi:hypothetical protein
MDARERNERGITVDRIKLLLLGLGLTSTMVGCSSPDIDSDELHTDGVYAEIVVLASTAQQGGEITGGGSDVTVDMRVDDEGSNTHLNLTGEDSLVVTAGEESHTLTGKMPIDSEFNGDEDGLEFTFSFERGEHNVDAPDSTVSLPPEFVVEGMEGVDGADPDVLLGTALELHLEGLDNEEVNYHVEGECLKLRTGSVDANNGDITIPASAFEAWEDEAAEPCGAKLYVEVVNKGSLDPAYDGGTIEAIRRVWVPFSAMP